MEAENHLAGMVKLLHFRRHSRDVSGSDFTQDNDAEAALLERYSIL